MKEREPSAETFDNVRARQLLLGLELSPVERLAWLEARRAELLRLQQRMSPAETQP